MIIKKRKYLVSPWIMVTFFCAIPASVMLLLYMCSLLHQEMAELQAIIAAYRLRVDILDNLIDRQTPTADLHFYDQEHIFSELSYECDSAPSFTLLNRNLDYLKESMHTFFKAQQLDDLFGHVDHSLWQQCPTHMLQKVQRDVGKRRVAQKRQRTLTKKNKTISLVGNEKKVLQWPIPYDKFWLSSLYGPRRKKDGSVGFHYGIDMAAIKGTPVMAAANGVVVQARYAGGLGNAVVIQHADHLSTRYAHLHEVLVRPGQKVFAGMVIGKVGETGYIRKQTKDGSHLHFELYKYNTRVNPLLFLPSIN